MAKFLLIHGSCHGAWCWELVCPLLAAMGHEAVAIDLPGHGEDETALEAVTLSAYARAVAEACRPGTTLVGHSMGGYAISAAAQLVPENITKLIYLCAYVPAEGVSLAERRMQAPRQPILDAVQPSADGVSFSIDPQKAPDLFYHDCPTDLTQAAVARLCPQAIAPTTVPLIEPPEQAALPRHYIRCMDDRTIPPEFQVTMTTDWPASDVQEMTCGHSPFYADPAGLAQRLHDAVR